jgi:RNA polymerase sigma factor (sigma-70 family)
MAHIESFEELVERAFCGDSNAFNHLYQFLYRYLAHFLNDHHAAEDVAQETLEKVWKGWKYGLRDRSKLKSWMFQITHNAAVDYIRKKKGASTTSLDQLEELAIREYIQLKRPEEIPEQYIELLEDARFVHWTLSHIPEPSRSGETNMINVAKKPFCLPPVLSGQPPRPELLSWSVFVDNWLWRTHC